MQIICIDLSIHECHCFDFITANNDAYTTDEYNKIRTINGNELTNYKSLLY